MRWYITNEARSVELVMIISYLVSLSRIIVLLKKSVYDSSVLILFRSKTIFFLAIYSQSCTNVVRSFIAEAFLDHIMYSM